MTPEPAAARRPRAKAGRIRRADLPRGPALRWAFGLLRYGVYGALGVAAEVHFYTLIKIAARVPVIKWLFAFEWRVDPSLDLDHVWDTPIKAGFGQSSFWMVPVYATCAFFFLEPLYRGLVRRHVLIRAAAYGIAIGAWEWASGWLLWYATGYKIWVYTDGGAIGGWTSILIWPVWGVTGLVVESVYRELMDPAVREALESTL